MWFYVWLKDQEMVDLFVYVVGDISSVYNKFSVLPASFRASIPLFTSIGILLVLVWGLFYLAVPLKQPIICWCLVIWAMYLRRWKSESLKSSKLKCMEITVVARKSESAKLFRCDVVDR